VNTNNNTSRLNAAQQSNVSDYCGCVFRRSGDMRSVVLNTAAINMARSIHKSIDSAFGELSLLAQFDSDKNAQAQTANKELFS
jgi:hypothetical protein